MFTCEREVPQLHASLCKTRSEKRDVTIVVATNSQQNAATRIACAVTTRPRFRSDRQAERPFIFVELLQYIHVHNVEDIHVPMWHLKAWDAVAHQFPFVCEAIVSNGEDSQRAARIAADDDSVKHFLETKNEF